MSPPPLLLNIPSLLPTPSLIAGDMHSRRFAASLTPYARDLPIRRALMYSDWEERSTAVTGAAEGYGTDEEGNRKLALNEPLTQGATGIITVSVVSAAAEAGRILGKIFSPSAV